MGLLRVGAKALAGELKAAGHDVRLEPCLNACVPCEQGQIVGRVDGQLVAQSRDEWFALV